MLRSLVGSEMCIRDSSFDAWFADTVRAYVQLNKGTIRIPHIYNLITGMRAHIAYNPTEQTGTIANLTCLLHKGSIVIDLSLIHI